MVCKKLLKFRNLSKFNLGSLLYELRLILSCDRRMVIESEYVAKIISLNMLYGWIVKLRLVGQVKCNCELWVR